MTWVELVKTYFTDIEDEEADYILWKYTAFPCASVDTIEEQIKHLKEVGYEKSIKKSKNL